ncbi:MAG: indole-3-glycerol-phosphate synthase [Gemmatimonadota bacterium]
MSPAQPLSLAIAGARQQGRVAVVADIKPVSPRDGDLLGGRSPAALARSLAGAGACALSVVTETRHFGGSCSTLAEVAGAVPLPVLRKDFLSRPAELDESLAAGAAAVLLILSTMGDAVARELHERAAELGLEAVVEVHTPQELERALRLEPGIVGINNRNILELERDPGGVATTEHLAPLVPEGITILSESALLTDDDVRRALAAGADAVLIGTLLLRAVDPAARLRELVGLEIAS